MIDGRKVYITHQRQEFQCGWCLKTKKDCPGQGFAKRWREKGTYRKDIREYMEEVKKKHSIKLPDIALDYEEEFVCEDGEDIDCEMSVSVGGSKVKPVTPVVNEEVDRDCTHISIKNIPLEKYSDRDIFDMLTSAGIPKDVAENEDNFSVTERGTIIMKGLSTKVAINVVKNLDLKKTSGTSKVMHVSPYYPVTPPRSEVNQSSQSSNKERVNSPISPRELAKDLKITDESDDYSSESESSDELQTHDKSKEDISVSSPMQQEEKRESPKPGSPGSVIEAVSGAGNSIKEYLARKLYANDQETSPDLRKKGAVDILSDIKDTADVEKKRDTVDKPGEKKKSKSKKKRSASNSGEKKKKSQRF